MDVESQFTSIERGLLYAKSVAQADRGAVLLGCGQLAPSPPSPQLQHFHHTSLWQRPEPKACCDHDKQTRRPSVSSNRRLSQQFQSERATNPTGGSRGHPNAIPSHCGFLGCDYLSGISNMVEDNFDLSGASAHSRDGRLG